MKQLGYSSPVVRKILAGKSPKQRAFELIRGTGLKDVAVRKKLYTGTVTDVKAANDPMIELARVIDPDARALRKIIETQNEMKHQAHARIAEARFAFERTDSYPDATFTAASRIRDGERLREGGQEIPYQTTLAGLYERAAAHSYRPPFDLTRRWIDRKNKLDLRTPFNFVSTADIIGGNSGSPVVNRRGDFVGIIFDGNIQSLVLDFAYTDTQARAVSVNSQAIMETLRKVYDASELVDEIGGKK